jgi:hypothetical protein
VLAVPRGIVSPRERRRENGTAPFELIRQQARDLRVPLASSASPRAFSISKPGPGCRKPAGKEVASAGASPSRDPREEIAMRVWIRKLGGAVALGALGLAPSAARAESAEEARMKALEERLRAVEDRLVASEATVQAQRELIQSKGLPDVAQGAGLDKFLSTLEIGGAVAASYAYNFNNPDTNPGTNNFYQFNTDHNSFSLDAVKLELGRKAAEPGSAGFQVDLLFGENANILAAASPYNAGRFYDPVPFDADGDGVIESGEAISSRGPGDTDVFIQEAYAAYNFRGVTLQGGKFETLLGFEVIDARLNPNITQGLLFTFAIPLYHTGVLASGTLGENFVWAAGGVNGFNNANDFGDNKGVLGRVGMVQQNFSLLLNTFIGAERTHIDTAGAAVGTNNRMQIYDLVGTLNATDQLMLWANADWATEDLDQDEIALSFPNGIPPEDDARWYGAAVGAKFALTEQTYVAVRGEWFHDDGGTRLAGANLSSLAFPTSNKLDDIDAYSGTVTLGHKLGENLLARLEFRHDVLDVKGGEETAGFPKSDATVDDQQDVGIVELTYMFD